jgi:hypothetical protein
MVVSSRKGGGSHDVCCQWNSSSISLFNCPRCTGIGAHDGPESLPTMRRNTQSEDLAGARWNFQHWLRGTYYASSPWTSHLRKSDLCIISKADEDPPRWLNHWLRPVGNCQRFLGSKIGNSERLLRQTDFKCRGRRDKLSSAVLNFRSPLSASLLRV